MLVCVTKAGSASLPDMSPTAEIQHQCSWDRNKTNPRCKEALQDESLILIDISSVGILIISLWAKQKLVVTFR